MATSAKEMFIVRPRFWPMWLRLTVPVQAVTLGLFLLAGVSGNWTWTVNWEAFGYTSAGLAGGCFLATLRGWMADKSILSPGGVSLPRPRGGYFRWGELVRVQVRQGLLGNRWLVVLPDDGPSFTLPLRPANVDGYREAVESFAGPDHPLTRAVWTTEGEGHL